MRKSQILGLIPTQIIYNKRTKQLTLDRFESGIVSEAVEKTTRTTTLDNDLKELRIYSDTSSLEIFVNDGEKVLNAICYTELIFCNNLFIFLTIY